jgi:signal transduction histidine kinase
MIPSVAIDAPASLTLPRRVATLAAYLLPPAIAASLCLMTIAGPGSPKTMVARAVLGTALLLVGLAVGAIAGCVASAVERDTIARQIDQCLDDLDHDLRAPMTIIRGEVELVLAVTDVPAEERERSSRTVIEQIELLEAMLRRFREAGRRPD